MGGRGYRAGTVRYPAWVGPTFSMVSRMRTRCSVDHGAPVVVPVGVLAGDAAVVVDQSVHGLGEGHDLGGAIDLDPGAEEVVAEHTHGGGGVAAEVADLVGGLPAADDDLAVAVDADGDR